MVSFFFLAMLISPMSHVDFKKWLCRRVDFRGQGPSCREALQKAFDLPSLCAVVLSSPESSP